VGVSVGAMVGVFDACVVGVGEGVRVTCVTASVLVGRGV